MQVHVAVHVREISTKTRHGESVTLSNTGNTVYSRFGLTLMVNHACNLRCAYCYTGAKFSRPMPDAVARRAIDRAVASVAPGGALELGFFGGEPLLEAPRMSEWLGHARDRADEAGIALSAGVTTNGALDTPSAWAFLAEPDLHVAVSHDGLPSIHDRHRRFADGRPSAALVEGTIRRLVALGRDFDVIVVVRPDTVASLSDGIAHLRGLGVRHIVPSLDLWTRWTAEDAANLENAVVRCARLWREGLPDFGISWFDEKAARICGAPLETARCGFGDGEIAVAPSGRLYPCERLIGDDADANPMRLPGHALEGADFTPAHAFPGRSADPCSACAIASMCGTTCRCSNYVRTGDVRTPDRLLCLLDQACARETARSVRTEAIATAHFAISY